MKNKLEQALPTSYKSYVDAFDDYLKLLKKWNRVFNLTALESDKDLINLHILDSLSINDYLHGDHILDVGTGAGLPGLILAIVNPDKHFTLLDSNGKKTRFLTQVKIELNLKNVTVVNARIEKFEPEIKFTTITSRAFSSLKTFYDKTHRLLTDDGILLAMKAKLENDMIEEMKKVSNWRLETHRLDLLSLDRHIIKMMR